MEEYDNSSRQIPGVRKDIDVHKSFRDAKETFTEAQVRKETARCLGCGASVVDEINVLDVEFVLRNVNLMPFICIENIRNAAPCINQKTR